MFKQSDVSKWFDKFEQAFDNMDRSIDESGDEIEQHLIDETNRFTPTDTRTMRDTRRLRQGLDEDQLFIEITFNETGQAPYAIEQHENPYYDHSTEKHPNNPPEAQYKYLERPLVDEWMNWFEILRRVGWK